MSRLGRYFRTPGTETRPAPEGRKFGQKACLPRDRPVGGRARDACRAPVGLHARFDMLRDNIVVGFPLSS
ncbi:protein of unknown function (plasmid) [Paraburkholderia dioscoreae]|uniref:Uncharacterized protein n=1 Tax=Paraburkholderia dioscoreae TaxID=2604047 RepID=A0A5Q4Z9I8_9BURK|nr:protein of unknown function [Paraburkholderia dioscoreae]